MTEKNPTIERPRPVMTTGLESPENKRPLIGSRSERKFMGLADSIGTITVDPNIVLTTSYDNGGLDRDTRIERQNELTAQVKKEIYDFIAFRRSERGLDIDIEAVEERLERATAEIFQYSYDNRAGGYSSILKDIYVYGDQGDNYENVTHRLTHELMHAASGQVYSVWAKEDKYSAPEKKVVGLRRDNKFGWLNEAFTELLTKGALSISPRLPEAKVGHYNQQQMLFDEMIRVSNIDLKLIYEAYFEEPKLDAPAGKRMPKWHALQSALNDQFGPHFLEHIENLIGGGVGSAELIKKLLEKDDKGNSGIDKIKQEWDSQQSYKIT